ncbi:hypothetical protein [Streptomyces sp. SP18CS02]|uniref:hypothetical protein n=1 Tax=Streptomyces sp. SP18CS02 TaxID=3002531 RepID=UPI002E7762E6|nr:hypothetical protein [Streptomyces sp. SP18CS02]MEE1756718.1 hypothetical protein [Streptomyces sp. SP18CS02]
MPRGRHRHSPPLHRLLPPSAVAGAAVLSAGGTWLFADPLVLRVLAAAAAAAAVTGSVLMRGWDRAAGRRVAELTRARAGDQWKTEERIAELETDVEESRELRAKLDAKLRAKRVELAALRNEHAELLRRYATAETERASALEGRRQLALEAAAPTSELTSSDSATTPGAYLRAAEALKSLSRNAAAQEARRTTEEARRRDLAERAGEADEPQGKHAAAAGGAPRQARPASALPARRPVPAAAAVVPYTQRRQASRLEGGFDFFGTQTGSDAQGRNDAQSGNDAQAGAEEREAGRPDRTAAQDGPAGQGAARKAVAAIESVQDEDLADVVGEEALAAHLTTRRAEERAVGKVIDLTAHDETEQFDVVRLRNAVG